MQGGRLVLEGTVSDLSQANWLVNMLPGRYNKLWNKLNLLQVGSIANRSV